MYKVELSVEASQLSRDEVDGLCKQADQIFDKEDLKCIARQYGKRVYVDRGRKQDYGRFWAAIFAIKDSAWLTKHLAECIWHNGNDQENLITEFLRD